MRKYFFIYFLPILFAITLLVIIVFKTNINSFLFQPVSAKYSIDSTYRFIANFQGNQYYEEQFLSSNSNSENIFLLGSSELTVNNEATPYNFITKNFKTKLRGIGHAGNQCFSIYSQLLANENRLKNAPIVIILSPGWFESKDSKGTSSEIFLEYISERFLKTIIKNETDTEFTEYFNKRISQYYNELNVPNIELKLINFKHLSAKSFLHKIIFYPILNIDKLIFNYKNILIPKNLITANIRQQILKEDIKINWDSLFSISKQECINNSNNNRFGINNQYYTDYIHGKRGKIESVNENVNTELDDFRMLIKLLKKKKPNISFIMLPLNPLYCKNLKSLLPTMNIIEKEINSSGFSYLNMFETDTIKYDKCLLTDIMHLSSYGWYKVDKFIIETYNLAK